MQIEDRSLAHDPDAPSWCDPIAMLVAWLARLFGQIANFKRIRRTTKFKPNWRDHFAGLRYCEWCRDQYRAYGAAQLLAGKDLDLSDFIPSTEPPADYGGPCPRTPFEMNRRFLAVARFNADSEADIRAYAARISSLASQATSPVLRAEEESHHSLSACGASRRWDQCIALTRACACTRDEGGSRSCRGPPIIFPKSAIPHLAGHTGENAPACA